MYKKKSIHLLKKTFTYFTQSRRIDILLIEGSMLHVDAEIAKTPEQALVSLEENRYGFSFFEIGFDLEIFERLSIERTENYNRFGDLSKIQSEVEEFFLRIGPNSLETARLTSAKVDQIVKRIMDAAGRETAWIALRATHPSNIVEISRWHMDGPHHRVDGTLQYKFVTALVGESTQFYPLSNKLKKFRSLIWENMMNAPLMEEICQGNEPISLKQGEGAFIIAADRNKAALHTVPKITKPRLYFSIFPCSNEHIKQVESIIRLYY